MRKYMGMRYKLLVVCFLLALAFLGIGSVIDSRKENQHAPQILHEMVEQCRADRSAGPYLVCLKKRIPGVVSVFGIRVVTDTLAEIFTQEINKGQVGWVSCHDIGHLVGEVFVENGGDVEEGLRECPDSCGFGCQHGALFAAISRDTRFDEKIQTLCSKDTSHPPQDHDACVHGVGHALTELAGRDIDQAREHCNSFRDDEDKRICFSGILMETIGFPTAGNTRQQIESDWLTYCSTHPSPFNDQCLSDAGANAFGLTQDYTESARVCLTLHGQIRGKCISSLGNIMYYAVDGNVDSYKMFCKEFSESGEIDCYRGYIESDVVTHPVPSLSVELCSELSLESKKNCFGMLGSKMAYVYGEQQMEAMCSRLKDDDRKYCMGE